ncbi:MAG TPA: hypothetical protein VFH90_11495 [Candidatus Limnocylindria bacterium]|nr:hypothetical protein [Candidatus Limnocylindria bacterium]
MTIPQQPDEPEIQDPTLPGNRPIDTPNEIPQREDPGWRAPGENEPPMSLPRENPDGEPEL